VSVGGTYFASKYPFRRMLPYAFILPLVESVSKRHELLSFGQRYSLAAEVAIDLYSAVGIDLVSNDKVSLKVDAAARLDRADNLEGTLEV
jgi:hypothetical protein